LEKYRHTRNLLETRVIIKILAHPFYPIKLTNFHGNEADFFFFCKKVFKMADSKKLSFSTTTKI
jgi:hypothetical protein